MQRYILGGVGIKVSGIYAIKNLINNKLYIGQSSNINVRWTHHKIDLNNNIHHNKHLQNAWNKYHEENFDFYVIEECVESKLDEREKYWINYYNTYYDGYNLDKGGNGIRGYKHTDDEINKMRISSSPLCVLQFDANFNFINEWVGGISHAAKELHITKYAIKSRCEKLNKKMTLYNNCYWIYKKEYESIKFTWDKYLSNCKIIDYKKVRNKKQILQYSLDKNLIKIWDGYFELKNNNLDSNIISKICNRKSTMNVYKNSFWCFKQEDIDHEYFNSIRKYKNKAIENKKRKVVQLDSNSEIINIFNSIKEASDYIKVKPSCISRALKNNGTSGGFKWIYA